MAFPIRGRFADPPGMCVCFCREPVRRALGLVASRALILEVLLGVLPSNRSCTSTTPTGRGAALSWDATAGPDACAGGVNTASARSARPRRANEYLCPFIGARQG